MLGMQLNEISVPDGYVSSTSASSFRNNKNKFSLNGGPQSPSSAELVALPSSIMKFDLSSSSLDFLDAVKLQLIDCGVSEPNAQSIWIGGIEFAPLPLSHCTITCEPWAVKIMFYFFKIKLKLFLTNCQSCTVPSLIDGMHDFWQHTWSRKTFWKGWRGPIAINAFNAI
jgi:hypothetical protein